VPDVLERSQWETPPFSPAVAPDERPARRTLLDQIEHLEGQLSALVIASWPRPEALDVSVPSRGRGPRLLDFAELEQLRDDLAYRVELARGEREAIARREEEYRGLIEDMMLAPEQYKWVRVSNENIGEPGCKHWHVRPRLGPVGLLMNWWRVKISSGCPLAMGCG
jgi:hypothetical protein